MRKLLARMRIFFYKLGVWLGLIVPDPVWYIGGSETLPPPLSTEAVSYTHLDVYKRQAENRGCPAWLRPKGIVAAVSAGFYFVTSGWSNSGSRVLPSRSRLVRFGQRRKSSASTAPSVSPQYSSESAVS